VLKLTKKKRILILGAGGASRGIILPILEQMPLSMTIANRTVAKALTLADERKLLSRNQLR
jgi:shikimate dehydrogenase